MENIYSFNINSENVFSIDTPPPTVSGNLHMGHVFSYCHADFIARFQRMSGKNVFYPMGFDDNGLPTERLVEKTTGVKVGFNFSEKSTEILKEITQKYIQNVATQIRENTISDKEIQKNKSIIESLTGESFDIKNLDQLSNFKGKAYHGICKKADFIEICRVVVKDAESEFEKLFNSINLSVDWDYKYQSISDNSAKIAQTAFVNLLEKGLIYSKYAPVYWCCADKTATANTEIEDKEMPGVQIEFNFTTPDGQKLLVMTTRPEMIPACRALLFNPEDDRFNGKKTGQEVITKMADGSEISSIGMDLNGKNAVVPIPSDTCNEVFSEENLDDYRQNPNKYTVRETQEVLILELIDMEEFEKTGEIRTLETPRNSCGWQPKTNEILSHCSNKDFYKIEERNKIMVLKNPSLVPILPDHEVKMDKGTGLVMCCTYGDWQDVIWAKRHNLDKDERIIVSEDGKIKHTYAKYTTQQWQADYDAIIAKNEEIMLSASQKFKEFGKANFPHKTNPELRTDYLKIEDARKEAIKKLEENGVLVSKKDIIHSVKCAERSGRPLEIIPTEQWYIRVLPFKKILLEMSKLVKFHPESMRIKLENWINGLSQDWCISRNRFFGIDIPVYWNEGSWNAVPVDYLPLNNNDYFQAVKKAVSDECDRLTKENNDSNRIIDKDSAIKVNLNDAECGWSEQVLDTWFTSGLSPHLSKGQNSIMSLRPQAHEIIRTWTFVTLVQSYLNLAVEITDEESKIDIHKSGNALEIDKKGYIVVVSDGKFLKCKKPEKSHLPWESVMLSGWCLANDKTKMSKSKGNIVTPTSLIDAFSSDAVRYWSGSASLGMDTACSEGQIKIGQRLITKLKNAAKLCFQTIEKSQITIKSHNEIIQSINKINNELDKSILNLTSSVQGKYKQFMMQYEYSKALDVVEKFFWTDFCDNYLELAKVRSYGLDAQIYEGKILSEEEKLIIIYNQNSASITMYYIIGSLLLMFAPFLVNTTDEIYLNSILKDKLQIESIHKINSFKYFAISLEESKNETWNAVIAIMNAIRKAKSENGISLKASVKNIKIPEKINAIFNNGLLNFNAIEDICNAGIVKKGDISITKNENIELILDN